jgi:glycosyltransferase involved in cell wall biosynthesis
LLTFSSRAALLWRLYSLRSWVQDHHIQVIHFHKSSDLRLVPYLSWLLPNVRLVFTEHMNAKKPKHSLYHRWVYKRLHQVVAISDHSLANNLRALPVSAHQIQRLYAGIDLQVFKPSLTADDRAALRSTLGLNADDIACCLPGRISPGKGHAVFVDALAQWAAQHKGPGRARGFIVGGLNATEGADEQLVAQLQARVRQMGMEELITFTGYSAQIHRLLQAMDMVCVPSDQEAFGLALVEAMALGLPVVGSNSGAIPEILGLDGACGLLAEPNKPEAFAQAFVQLAESETKRTQIGECTLTRVRTTFDIGLHVNRLKNIYQIL